MSDEEDRTGSGEEDVAQEDLDIGIPLSKDIVIRSLSRLERVGDGSQHALTKLDASGNELNCIELLKSYPLIRYVYLSSNQLEDLSQLSCMKHLLAVDANRNKMKKLNIEPMDYLQILDLSYNQINTFDGMEHPRLKTLNLNSNALGNLDTMSTCAFTNLEVLELRNNGLETLVGIGALPNLKKLYIAQNRINNLGPLTHLKSLETLHARENEIANLEGVLELENLLELNMRQNLIAELSEFDHLVRAKKLLNVSFTDNPVSEEDEIRIRVLLKNPNIVRINKISVTEEERIEVKEFLESQAEDE